jgi:glycerophosphoryl diester phosphodiesterase
VSATTVVSHRGLSGPEPENSLKAFCASVARGIEAIEFDVRQTLDDVLVVSHDTEVAGLSIGDAAYKDLAAKASELCTLEEALAAIPLSCLLDIEVKVEGIEEAVLREAHGARCPSDYVLTSFNDQTIARIKAIDPTVRAGLLLEEDPAGRARTTLAGLHAVGKLQSCGADFLAAHWKLLSLGFLQRMRQSGFPVWVWTVNSSELMTTLIQRPEIAAIVTDHPLEAMRLRNEQQFLD